VLVLLGIGFLGGLLTAISPCVLPVLPIIFAGGATGGRRRPYAVIGGLVASFTLFTLAGGWILDLIGLPQDFLRNVAIAMLFLLAATLLVPRFGELLERPFLPLTRRRAGSGEGVIGGLVLGASLGLVFVPCAGPVLATITVLSATRHIGLETVLLTLAYALGAALPMLLFAIGGQRAVAASKVFRTHAAAARQVAGVLVAATALAIVFNVDRRFQTVIPGYASAIQNKIEGNAAAQEALQKLREPGGAAAANPAVDTTTERAPDFRGIAEWLNTPDGKPLTLAALRGKVVLVDFWTYSCINCLRTLPHLKAWDAAYRKDGLVIVGVHSPEFSFEHVPANVRTAVRKLGLRYPVALDNDFKTWQAYANEYWPAEYLIDRTGRIRHTHFGEGEYETTESVIRKLLGERVSTPRTAVADATPDEITTPESYLGYARLDRFASGKVVFDREATYRFPAKLRRDSVALSGRWRIDPARIVAGTGARLRLHFHARDVYLVLGGVGQVEALVDGKALDTLHVSGNPRLYTIASYPRLEDGILELRFAPRVEGYAFTFG
jgi:cytochrome c biogenesis protein CcdA/thiol-disulfide isomerase/thioredoxin